MLQEVSGGNDYVAYGGRTVRVETFLEQFLFPGAMKQARIGSLSGGEKNRVLLAKLLCAGGNLLVLDEPTNDLDLASLRALEDALLAFTGTVVVVSHDRWFLDRVASRVVHLDGSGKVRQHAGDLSLLLDKLAVEKQEAAAAESAAAAAAAAAKAKATAAQAAPKAKKLSTREQKELEELPAKIEAAESELRRVDEALSQPSIYEPSKRDEFERCTALRKELPGRIEALYARWEALEAVGRG